jgi:hypothetical protein
MIILRPYTYKPWRLIEANRTKPRRYVNRERLLWEFIDQIHTNKQQKNSHTSQLSHEKRDPRLQAATPEHNADEDMVSVIVLDTTRKYKVVGKFASVFDSRAGKGRSDTQPNARCYRQCLQARRHYVDCDETIKYSYRTLRLCEKQFSLLNSFGP